jgi:hypothetical protein
MPGPLRKRKRQPRERVSAQKADDLATVASEAAETDEGESPRGGPDQARSRLRGAGAGEYRPL